MLRLALLQVIVLDKLLFYNVNGVAVEGLGLAFDLRRFGQLCRRRSHWPFLLPPLLQPVRRLLSLLNYYFLALALNSLLAVVCLYLYPQDLAIFKNFSSAFLILEGLASFALLLDRLLVLRIGPLLVGLLLNHDVVVYFALHLLIVLVLELHYRFPQLFIRLFAGTGLEVLSFLHDFAVELAAQKRIQVAVEEEEVLGFGHHDFVLELAL